MKKSESLFSRIFFKNNVMYKLSFDSFCWTNTFASAAIDAGRLINFKVRTAFRDSADWTFAGASAAADAFIRDCMCHKIYLLYIYKPILIHNAQFDKGLSEISVIRVFP